MHKINNFESGSQIFKTFEDDTNHKLISQLKVIKMKSNRNMFKSSTDLIYTSI